MRVIACLSAVSMSAVLVAGCAMTYRQPTSLAQHATGEFRGTMEEGVKAARRALVNAGYQITSSDEKSGTISTAPRNLRVTPEQADCGKTMGLDYLLDKRSSTRVAMGVVVDQSKIVVRSTIEGEYRPGSASQDITFTCVSRGPLENDMLGKVLSEVGH